MAMVRTRRWLVGTIMVGILGISGFNPATAVYQIGEHVNDFTLRNWDNQWMSLYDYSDQIVVLAFWFAS